jgi:catechol-2,3-dioxygenase
MSPLSGPPGVGSPVRVNKIGYVAVRTQDVDALVAYYTDVLGLALVSRDADRAYLTTGSDHHAVAITKGDPHGRAALGFQVHGSLDDVQRSLSDAGVAAQRRGDPEEGIADAVVVLEPLTETPVVLYERQAASGVGTSLGLRPTKLGHVAGYVPQLAPVQAFWEQTLGFRWSDIIGDFFVFLRCNADHHAVNLMASTKRSGLHHAAFEVRDMIHLKDLLDQLARHEIRLEWGPGRHGAGHNVFTYHRDPDGNVIELFTELDVVHDEDAGTWEPRPWHESFPQGPRQWEPSVAAANAWGPINPEMLDH